MDSRESILESIRKNTYTRYDMPDLEQIEAIVYPDLISQFCEIIQQVGGKAVLINEGETADEVIKGLYPEVKRVASNLPQITCATFNPDQAESPAALDGTELAVIDASFGVAENGAVWIAQDVKWRAIYFIAERLVILLDRNQIVNNMHEAYKRIATEEYRYGVFISGPSKTADIEQALVMGAHGAKEVTILLK